MLLHQTPLLELLYEPKTDILRVNWPDVQEAQPSEIELSLDRLKSSVNTYFITRLLIDSSQTTYLYEVETLRKIWMQLLGALSNTNLQKLARICSLSPAREALAQEVFRQIVPEASFPQVQFAQFKTEAEATVWLLEAARK